MGDIFFLRSRENHNIINIGLSKFLKWPIYNIDFLLNINQAVFELHHGKFKVFLASIRDSSKLIRTFFYNQKLIKESFSINDVDKFGVGHDRGDIGL